jgi:cell division inhibitor SulA
MTTQLVQSQYLSQIAQAPIQRRALRFFDYCSPLINQCHYLVEGIRNVKNSGLWITLIDPPFLPNKSYLSKIGLGHYAVRVVRLNGKSPAFKQQCIEQCVLNGKSGLVAIWSTHHTEVPSILKDDDLETPLCQTMVFEKKSSSLEQLEMSF